ncbi:MFS transporter [Phaeovibrio sulfidiphilus]|uniref:MFS transporter n=1 Tax=Phaeovibrio sulfidiphilus TaxID=1220600 RepID=A0A8J6YM77_9PROT|nr:MFS transporter [Phaeovibrio sulfidiphilus]MBE1237255.1 MFS transporter [Phaeovibrio sulfidiphilus]
MPTPNPSFLLRAWLVLCALAVVSLLYLPLPVLPELAVRHALSPAGAAGMISAFGFAYAAGFLVFGPLSDRIGRRTVMIVGLAGLSLVTFLLTFAESAWPLLVGRGAQGFLAAAFPPVVVAYLSERGTPKQRIWSVAWLSTAFLSAGLVGQVLGGEIGGRWGLERAFLPSAVICLVTALALLRTPAESPAAADRPMFDAWKSAGRLFAHPGLRRCYLAAFFLLLCFVAFYVALDMHLGLALLASNISPLMAREIALPAFFAPLCVALVIARLGARRVVIAGLALASAGLLVAALVAGNPNVFLFLGASVLFVFGVGTSVPGLIASVAGAVDPSLRGLAVSLYTFLLFVGASLGPWLAQALGRWPVETTLAVLSSLLGAATLFLVFERRAVTPVA